MGSIDSLEYITENIITEDLKNNKDILNYKNFYKPSIIKKNVDLLVKKEIDSGFFRLLGYSKDMDNFLNVVEIDLIQECFLSQLKKYCNITFGLFKVFYGMDIYNKKIIEERMIVFNNINTEYIIISE